MIFAFLIYLACTMQAFAYTVPASGAVVIDVETGKVIYEQDANERLYPASTTKIMTALLALEHLNLDDNLTVPADFVNDGEAGIWLEPGEQQTVEAMLMAMMLRSANDAAQILAMGVAGSIDSFALMMNQKVVELGLENTHFVNPNGLHDDDHYTSAYDLAMIAREAVQYDDFNRIIVTERYQLPWVQGEYDRVVYNRNSLLDRWEAADGIKNGYTSQAGSCLVSSATVNGRRLIGVVLNSSDMYATSQAMLEYAFSIIDEVELCNAWVVKGQVTIDDGNDSLVNAKTATDLSALVTNGDVEFTEQIELPTVVEAPVHDGDILGKITYTNASGETYSTDLIADKNVSRYTLTLLWKQVWQSVWQVFVVPINKQ